MNSKRFAITKSRTNNDTASGAIAGVDALNATKWCEALNATKWCQKINQENYFAEIDFELTQI